MISSRVRSTLFSQLSYLISVSLALVLLVSPLCAQRPGQGKPAPARPIQKPHEIAFETLLSDDSYKVYGEIRNVGQLFSTGGAGEIIEPVMKLADPPGEFTALIKFLNANVETLATSRLMFATWPARKNLPSALVAIELASPEEAEKFEPKLNRVLPAILPKPTPTPVATPTPGPTPAPARSAESTQAGKQASVTVLTKGPAQNVAVAGSKPEVTSGAPFVVSRSGSLIFVSDKAFKFEQLRPADTKLLSENQNFRLAHDRFQSEPVFVFVNVALEDKTKPKPPDDLVAREAIDQDAKVEIAEQEKKNEAAPAETPEPMPEPTGSPQPDYPEMTEESVTVLEPGKSEPEPTPNPTQQVQAAAFSQIGMIFRLLTRGEIEWPDAVGVAIAQESDSYVVRAVLVGPENSKRLVVPFAPQLIAGRAIAPNAPSVLPDDTEILITASFDLPRTYEAMQGVLEAMNKERVAELRRLPASMRVENDEEIDDPFIELEKKGAFKIKDELLPALGNEIAIAGSFSSLQGFGPLGLAGPPRSQAGSGEKEDSENKKPEEQAMPMLLVSIRDREAARRLMPHLLDATGIGEAKLVARTERRDDTEMIDFAGVFAYAFVGDFVIISSTVTVRRAIDRYLGRQTLSGNTSFRNFTRWQPRETVGQIYISPALMETYQKSVHDPSAQMPAGMREFLMRLNPVPQAITYAMSNEGFGGVHELHLPKTFVLASVAGAASFSKEPPPEVNEEIAIGSLQSLVSAEETYKATAGKGKYGSLDDLFKLNLISKEMFDKYGYTISLTVSGDQFEATAVPAEYGKSGRRSFFVDQSGVVRGDDHAGGPATAADKPVR